MANLKLEHIYKVYPNGTKAVNDFSLDIKNGEFIVFVGPSGCGKSTTLRMIAGLEDITAGELYIDNDIVNDMEPKDRDIAMVFQNYALYPHMTVYENMAFGLRLRHVPDDVIQEKVLWAADILGIKEYLDRKPRNMSGGQRQRVSLGRAILRDPKVMLLDEPLSNLDAKLRAQMRTEIAKLHQKLKTTFIYVTHDQTEAMTLGDRVVVMKAGRIQQVDTPKNLYNYPGNKFVAGFIGTPQMNFFDCTLKKVDKDNVVLSLPIAKSEIKIEYNYLLKVLPQFLDGNHPLTMGVRCEHVHLVDENDGGIKVHISHFEELGSECLIYGSISDELKVDSDEGQIIIKVKDIGSLTSDSDIYVQFDLDHIYFFDKESEETIVPRVPVYNSFDVSIKDNYLNLLGEPVLLPKAISVNNIDDAILKVPTSAIKLDTENGVVVKVVNSEHINDIYLIHLLKNGRIFFAISDKDYEINKEIKVRLDYTKLTLVKDEKEVFSPINDRDSFYASFMNYETVMSITNNQKFVAYKEAKIKKVEDEFALRIEDENKAYEEKKKEITSNDVNATYEKALASFEELKTKNLSLIEEKKIENKTAIKEMAANYKLAKKDAKIKNNALFSEMKEKEDREFKEFKLNNKDKVALKRRSDEYHIFKDNFQTDKENTLNRAINTLTMDYESRLSSQKAMSKREIDLLKKEISDAYDKLKELKDPLVSLDKEHTNKLKELESALKEEKNKASFVFFFKFPNGYYSLIDANIANKLIQGLSTRVFSRNFKIDLLHDSYKLSDDETAFKAKVVSSLDYADVYYIELSYVSDDGKTYMFYLTSDKELEVGSEVKLDFDLLQSQITETDMNIRLY